MPTPAMLDPFTPLTTGRVRRWESIKTMNIFSAISIILALSSWAESLPARPPSEFSASALRIPRGGAGIFSRAMDVVEDRSRDVAKYSKVKAADFDDATDRIREEALARAQKELKELEKESKRWSKEASIAAKKKAAELEKEARTKADDLASVAKQTALLVATRWEKEARKKALDVEKALKKKAAEVGRESQKRVEQLERSISGKKESLPTPQTQSLLSAKTSAILAHLLLLAVVCASLTNLTGYPPAVITHWESGFGDKFIPLDAITLAQKRMLAGALEMSSIFLMRPKKTRIAGVGLITAMYTGAAVINIQLNSAGKAVALAVLSAMAWLLLANEIF